MSEKKRREKSAVIPGQPPKAVTRAGATPCEIAAWIIMAAGLLMVFPAHLFGALMAGLLVFELVHMASPLVFAHRIGHRRARMVVVGLLGIVIVAVLAVLIWKTAEFFRSDDASLQVLFKKMAEILENFRAKMPDWALESLPANVEEINQGLSNMLRQHAAAMQEAGKGVGLGLAHVVIGLIFGAIVALSAELAPARDRAPLSAALIERVRRVGDAFRSVVFAQVRISALNTTLTLLYLMVILPACGVRLPLVKTMVAITFVVGLLPVIGNLISNTVIVVVSLSWSFSMALWSLLFLVVIHKLEYFLNARIVGGQIKARTWELLLAMLLMESVFGLSGLIAAPVYYAYLKQELRDRGLI